MKQPKYCRKEHLKFLDELRESGITNMYRSSPYLRRDFPTLSKEESYMIVAYWMKTFTERHEVVNK